MDEWNVRAKKYVCHVVGLGLRGPGEKPRRMIRGDNSWEHISIDKEVVGEGIKDAREMRKNIKHK
jgi:hypothetical protein